MMRMRPPDSPCIKLSSSEDVKGNFFPDFLPEGKPFQWTAGTRMGLGLGI